MTDRLAEIAARLEAATPIPWDCDGFADGDVVSLAIFPERDRADIIANCIEKHDDAAFLLNAPADIAYLLAELAEAWQMGKEAGFRDAYADEEEEEANPYKLDSEVTK